MSFTQYIALGDSMSIDLYPALDADEADVAVALEWDARAGRVAPLGAASLLHSNVDDRFPEFSGRDLVSRYPDIAYLNVAEDGATIGDVFGEQLTRIPESDERTLLTLTIGGNDLLSAYSNRPSAALLHAVVKDIGDAYEFLVESLARTRPNGVLVLTTVYDPSDESRKIPGVFEDSGPLPLEALAQFNDRVRVIAAAAANRLVADVYRHFLGHGVRAAEGDRWYWKRSLVEPNAEGASEIRRQWLDALDDEAED